MKCQCGCKGEASFIVKSEDYQGNEFEEPCCINSYLYLRECAEEFNKPFSEIPLML